MAITVKIDAQAKTLAQLEVLLYCAKDCEEHFFTLSYQDTSIELTEIWYNRQSRIWHVSGRITVIDHSSSNPEYNRYTSAWSMTTTRKDMALNPR